MKILFLLSLLSLGFTAVCQYPTCPQYQNHATERYLYEPYPTSNDVGPASGWVKIDAFSDEFVGNSIDRTKWDVYNDFCHPMSPQAYFKDDQANVKVENNILKLRVTQDPQYCEIPWIPGSGKDYDYASGYIQSQNSFHYGYVEMKCHLPAEMIVHPSFWMVGALWAPPRTIWSDYDEIDVFELTWGDPSTNELLQNFIHKPDDSYDDRFGLGNDITFDQSFADKDITFAIEWLPTELHYFINNKITATVKYAGDQSKWGWINPEGMPPYSDFTCLDFTNALSQQFQISLSLENFTNWSPNPNDDWDIDYVRSYKLVEGYNYEYWPLSFYIYDPDLFKVHKSIKLGGDGHTAIIIEGYNLCIWARDSIVLDKGFTVYTPSEFTARTIQTDPDLVISQISE